MARSLRFQPPPPRTVHAVLPHTAHRRRSPAAFGFPRQSRKGLGATTIPDKVIRPSRLGEAKATTHRPNAKLRRWRLLMKRSSRIRAYSPILSKRAAELPYRKQAAQEPVQVLHDPLRCHQQPGPVRYLPDPVAGMLHGLVRGPAGKENDPAFPGGPSQPHQAVVEAEEVDTLAPFLQVPGRRRELPPPPPTDLGVNLSIHPARAVQLTSHAGSGRALRAQFLPSG